LRAAAPRGLKRSVANARYEKKREKKEQAHHDTTARLKSLIEKIRK
jgi:hypothetical protein